MSFTIWSLKDKLGLELNDGFISIQVKINVVAKNELTWAAQEIGKMIKH